ncbi:putative ATP-dependent helicase [Sulfurisphaera tokodaii str. 7]|uniref:ATP-dependent helicase n=1 Tax=Sulfurisphaera tokodaii (strain DSM 16993 / JCM 10545 / NBRC 100140 / 7) TaxID=273063 RepID=Q977E4_SULTO|nr:DEAD/DEAH box helicase [Sulfurisphaera tokodaii]BAB64950.1 putative ATP-dependent helicase [Sulfurisphaera tokodaii str. 7]
MICDSSSILSSLDLVFQKFSDSGVPYTTTNVKFRDVLPTLCSRNVRLCDLNMYQHQLEAINKLMQGKNLVVNAETGGGKTEIWVSYALEMQLKGEFNVLAIYPTKALAGDQIERIVKYYIEAGFSVSKQVKGKTKIVEVYYGDVIKYDGDVSNYIQSVKRAKTLLTNPEVVKNALFQNHKISDFLKKVRLIVVDEFDFYGSSKSTVLLHIIKGIIDKFGIKPQIVIMSATLSDPEVVKPFFDVEIIGGKSFRPANDTYIVLGKRDELNAISKALNVSFDDLVKNFFKYASDPKKEIYFLQLFKDNAQLLPEYLDKLKGCDELTIIFSRSISEANNLVGKLGGKVNYDGTAPVAVHHSGIDKYVRQQVENDMRSGKLKVVVTVKTLLQGIDVGNVTRVVHVGIPDSVREFIQREGRKGRMASIKRTESVIFPLSLSDAVLLEDYSTSLKEWLSLGSESLILLPDNEFLKLIDVIRGILNDREFLKSVGITGTLPQISFYEQLHKTVPKLLFDGKNCNVVDKLNYRDVVEKHQLGCIDPMLNAIVVRNSVINGKRHVIETSDFSSSIMCNNINISSHVVNNAIAYYEDICFSWKQHPDLNGDIERGKVWSKVSLDVLFEGDGGFKQVHEIARKVFWYIESRRKIGQEYKVEKIELEYTPSPNLKYDFLTYVYASELEPDDVNKVDKGMYFILALLRLNYGIDLGLINFGVSNSGILKIWESEPTALLKRLREMKKVKVRGTELDCKKLLDDVRNAQPFRRLELVLKYLDPYTFNNFDFNEVKAIAERFVHYLCNTIPIQLQVISGTMIPKSPLIRSIIIDSFGGKYAVSSPTGEISIFDNEEEAVKEAAKLNIEFTDAIVVPYGVSIGKKYKFQNEVVYIDKEINRLLGGPITPSKFRELVLNDDSLLKEENEADNSITRGEEVELTKIFRKRAETIRLMINLWKAYLTDK